MRRYLRALLFPAYPVAHWLAFLAADLFWHPPAGLRFAVFAFVKPRWWLPLSLSNEVFAMALDPAGWRQGYRGLGWFLCFFLGAALGPWLLRHRRPLRITGPTDVAWLLGAMLLSAAGETVAHVVWPFRDAKGMTDVAGMPMARLWLTMTLGDYIGMLILVPIALMVVRQRPRDTDRRAWMVDLPAVMLPVLGGIAILLAGATDYRTYFLATGLCVIPASYMAFRSGWRGAALALSAISILMVASGVHNGNVKATVESQLLVATVGSTLLILGAAIDALRDNQRAMDRRNAELQDSNRRLNALAGELRDTSRRNLTLSEDLRRRITSDLHDELGQDLTALQVRVKLIENSAADPAALAPVRELVAHMRTSVSRLMANLRPAGLDEFGLARALGEGGVREFVESAGLGYSIEVNGDPGLLDRLDNDAQTMLYRIVQEAATNTVRHAQARDFHVQLRLRPWRDRLNVVVVCADDGRGFEADRPTGGVGLVGIIDRVLSFGGKYRFDSGAAGTRLLVTVSLPAEGQG